MWVELSGREGELGKVEKQVWSEPGSPTGKNGPGGLHWEERGFSRRNGATPSIWTAALGGVQGLLPDPACCLAGRNRETISIINKVGSKNQIPSVNNIWGEMIYCRWEENQHDEREREFCILFRAIVNRQLGTDLKKFMTGNAKNCTALLLWYAKVPVQ